MEKELMTIKQAAKFCGKSPSSVRYWIDYKGLSSTIEPVDGRADTTMIDREDLEAFILEMRSGR